MIKSKLKNKLAIKIPLQIIGIISAIMIIICIVLSVVLFNIMSVNVQSEINYIDKANANKAQAYLDRMNTISKSISQEVTRYKELDTNLANQMLINSLNGVLDDENIFSAYFAFEPNKFFDNTPKGKSYYAFRDGGKIKMDLLNDYDVYSTGDYYATTKNIMSTHITQPYAYELTTGETVWLITLSNPVLDMNGNFIGVANCDILTEYISKLPYDLGNYQTAYSYILTDEGTYISHTSDNSLIGSTYINENDNDSKIINAVKNGESLLQKGTNLIFGDKALVFHQPITIQNTDLKWSSGFVVSQKELNSSVNYVVLIVAIIAIVGLIILAILSFLIIKKSLSPISSVMNLAEKMKHGILNSDEEIEIKTNDELGELTRIFKETSLTLNDYITDIAFVLDNISSGNLKIGVGKEYIGDFKSISTSLNKIIESLNLTFNEIQITAEEVSSGSEQVASAALQLSQGATEQASSVEEFAATIQEISNTVQHSADNALDANEKATHLGVEIDKSNQQMKQMVQAMNVINDKSKEIGKIIKTIEDIAFQTNILALNAAVEAARAGTAGKGFAVVADEVRNLASKSAEAAKNTTLLIEDTINAVKNGTVIANNTEQTLLDVVEETNKIIDIIDTISKESQDQSSSIEQVTIGMDQISSVIQTNSATAEESAASSEELSNQAETMKSLVKKFKLKNL